MNKLVNQSNTFSQSSLRDSTYAPWEAKTNFGSWINNAMSGNLDYARELEMLGFNQSFNASEAEKNRQFQERMSNTSYQRVMEDLRQAGVNPYLAINQGGASTPSGSVASSGGAHHARSGQQFSSLLGGIISTASMLATAGMSNATRMAIASGQFASAERIANINKRNGQSYFDRHGNYSGGIEYY